MTTKDSNKSSAGSSPVSLTATDPMESVRSLQGPMLTYESQLALLISPRENKIPEDASIADPLDSMFISKPGEQEAVKIPQRRTENHLRLSVMFYYGY